MSLLRIRTIRTRIFVWLVIVAMLFLATSDYYTYQYNKETLENQIKSKLLAIASHKVLLLKGFVNERIGDTIVTSQNPFLAEALLKVEKTFVNQGANSPAYAEAINGLKPFLTPIVKQFDYKNLSLLSRDGTLIYSLLPVKDFGHNLLTEPQFKNAGLTVYLQAILDDKNPRLFWFQDDPMQDTFNICVAAPIFYKGNVVGIIQLSLTPENLYSVVSEPVGLGQTGEITLGVKIGDEVVFMSPLRFNPDAIFKTRAKLGPQNTLPMQHAVMMQNGEGLSTDYQGKEVWAVWRYLPDLNLGLVVKEDIKEVFAPAERIKFFFIIVFAISCLVIISLTAFASRAISAPIRRLTEIAEIVANGNLDQNADIGDATEVGQLASTFNKMAQQVRENELRLDLAITAGGIGLWSLDLNTGKAWRSLQHAKIFGYENLQQEWSFDIFLSHVIPEDREYVKQRRQTALDSGQINLECRITRKNDQAIRWISATGSVYRDEQGKPSRMTGTVMDITDRKRAIEDLELQSAINVNAAEGIMLVKASDSSIFYTNLQFEEMLGYAPGELVGKPVTIINAPTSKSPQEVADEISHALEKNGVWRGEVLSRRKVGTTLWTFANVSTLSHPEHGKLWISYQTDITQRKQIEGELGLYRNKLEQMVSEQTQALRDSERKYKAISEELSIIFNCDPTLIWHKDLKNNVLRVNRAVAEATGLSIEQLEGKSCHDLFPGEAEKYYQDDLEVIRSGKPKMGIIERLVSKKGGYLWIQTDKIPYFDDKGEMQGILLFVTDITALKQNEQRLQHTVEQLMHSDKLAALGKLIASIAHEFNNPLFGVLNVVELTLEQKGLSEEIVKLLRLAVRECNRMADMIRKLREFYKPSDGVIVAIDVHQAIEGVLLLQNKELQVRKIKVHKIYDPKLPLIFAVEDQIKQVFLNLLQNATDAMPEGGGLIDIVTETLGTFVKVTISDSGEGISEENIKKIFEPFFTTRAVEGTGLGLPVSYNIIKSLGGEINVESKIGRGTTFTVLLPLKKETFA